MDCGRETPRLNTTIKIFGLCSVSPQCKRCMSYKKQYIRNYFQTSFYFVKIKKRRLVTRKLIKENIYDFS